MQRAAGRRSGWRPVGARARGAAVLVAVIAPGAQIGVGLRGDVIVWTLVASTVILRWRSQPAPRPPRWFVPRSRALVWAGALGAVAVAIGGVLAFQVATPALRVMPGQTSDMFGSPPDTASRRVELHLKNVVFADVTMLGVGEPFDELVRLEMSPGSSDPFVVRWGGSVGASMVLAPGACPTEVDTPSDIAVRYRVLGIERISHITLPSEYRLRCNVVGRS